MHHTLKKTMKNKSCGFYWTCHIVKRWI